MRRTFCALARCFVLCPEPPSIKPVRHSAFKGVGVTPDEGGNYRSQLEERPLNRPDKTNDGRV